MQRMFGVLKEEELEEGLPDAVEESEITGRDDFIHSKEEQRKKYNIR
jgi:hypothetical protein